MKTSFITLKTDGEWSLLKDCDYEVKLKKGDRVIHEDIRYVVDDKHFELSQDCFVVELIPYKEIL